MQHDRVVLEEGSVGDVWRGRDGRKKDQITGPHKLSDAGNNRDRTMLLKAARRVSEFLTLERRPVVYAYFLDRPSRIDKEVVHVPCDEPSAHDAQRMRSARLPSQPVGGKSSGRSRSGRRDSCALADGKGVPI